MYAKFVQKLIQTEQLNGFHSRGFLILPPLNQPEIIVEKSSQKCNWSRMTIQIIVINKQLIIFFNFS